MHCHECYLAGYSEPSVALCHSCLVALCGDHLALSVTAGIPPVRYGCAHLPGERPRAISAQRLERVPATA
jgi:hypothetical protein